MSSNMIGHTPVMLDEVMEALAPNEDAIYIDGTFGGGGYTALQRSAILQLAWDQVASGLDGREAAFELYASGGPAACNSAGAGCRDC